MQYHKWSTWSKNSLQDFCGMSASKHLGGSLLRHWDAKHFAGHPCSVHWDECGYQWYHPAKPPWLRDDPQVWATQWWNPSSVGSHAAAQTNMIQGTSSCYFCSFQLSWTRWQPERPLHVQVRALLLLVKRRLQQWFTAPLPREKRMKIWYDMIIISVGPP